MSVIDKAAISNNFCATLRGVKDDLGLTNEEFSEQTGLHIDYVKKILRCKSTPSVPNLYRLCVCLKHSASYLLGFDKENKADIFDSKLDDDINRKEFSKRLEIALESTHQLVPRTYLSNQTGLTSSQISQYISGYCYPRLAGLYAICRALKVSPDYLLGFTDEMKLAQGDDDEE